MDSLFIYLCDAAVERCNRSSYRVDTIIDPPGYPSPAPAPRTWDMQIVEPIVRIAF